MEFEEEKHLDVMNVESSLLQDTKSEVTPPKKVAAELDEPDEDDPSNLPQVPLSKFFAYLTAQDKLLLFIGTFAALIAGAILPSVSLIMGNVATAFSGGGSSTSGSDIISNMSYIASYVVIIAMSLFTFSYMFYAFWQHLAENITTDLRKRYIVALMRQEVAFFEKNKVEELPAQISEVFETVKTSLGEQISNLMFAVFTLVSSIVYALSFGPLFAGYCLCYLPILLGTLGIFGSMVRKFTV